MKGIIYRFGVALKDAGERAGHKKLCFADLIICFGVSIRDFAAKL